MWTKMVDKAPAPINTLVNKTLLSCCSKQGKSFLITVVHSSYLSLSYMISLVLNASNQSRESTRNAILKCLHGILCNMSFNTGVEGKEDLDTTDIDHFIMHASWAVCFTHNTILGSSTVAAVIGWDIHIWQIRRHKSTNANGWSTMHMHKKMCSKLSMIMPPGIMY